MDEEEAIIRRQFADVVKNHAFVCVTGETEKANTAPDVISISVFDAGVKRRLESLLGFLVEKQVIAPEDFVGKNWKNRAVIMDDAILGEGHREIKGWAIDIVQLNGSAGKLCRRGYIPPDAIRHIIDPFQQDMDTALASGDDLARKQTAFYRNWLRRN